MRLLALDTTSDACSVALQVGDTVQEKHVVEPRQHSKILLTMIDDLLDEAGIALAGLDAVILGNGPGSFIGLRIGASVAQGICHGAGLDIVPVSSLAAVAAEALAENDLNKVIVAQDARMQEVYVGLYERDDSSLPRACAAEALHSIGEISGLGEAHLAAGSAWRKFPLLWSANEQWLGRDVEVIEPRARFLLGLGGRALQNGEAIAPASLEPAYIRVKVAEKPLPRNSGSPPM